MTIQWIIFLWCMVVESIQIYCFQHFLVQNFNYFLLNINHYSNIWQSNNLINHISKIKWKSQNIYRQERASLFQVQEKLRVSGNSKWSFLRRIFIAGDSHRKIIPSNTLVFNKITVFYFSDSAHLLRYFPIKVPQNFFDLFNCANQTGAQISKFSFCLKKQKTDFKVFVNCRSELVM